MDVLDQAEIEALLAAVEGGAGGEEAGHRTTMLRRSEEVVVQDYDFRRPERVSKDQMRALATLHEAFARNFGASLSGFLRTIVEIKQSSCEQMTYAEFTSGLPNPTCFNLLTAEPLEGQMCLELSPLIVYPIIDRLLGGSSQSLFVPQRALTQIEAGLMGKVTQKAMDCLREAWEGIRELKFRLGEMESNPQLVQIVSPNEVVVVVGFEVRLGSRAGTMNLCIPFNVIEPVVPNLASQSWFMTDKNLGREEMSEQIRARLDDAAVESSVILAETTIRVSDLVSLAPGDVITTETRAASPVVMRVEGVGKFRAQIGQHRGQRAVRVVGGMEEGEK